jgi:ABC-type branched-subunit amino acid transport system ATPase component/MFS family permease
MTGRVSADQGTRVARLTGTAPLRPLLVLGALNLVDEFDRIAFAALTPEIRDAFGISDTVVGTIGVVAGAFIVLAAVPVGWVADRLNRLHLAAVAAVLWGTMSVLTGLVPTVALLFLVRLLAGVGRVTNEIAHPSLLTDYYDKEQLPQVFKVYRLANPVGAVAGLIAGGIAVALSWQWAFFLLAVPTFLLLGFLRGLREPARGARTDPELAERLAAEAAPVSFAEARRQLYGVRSLRRIWASSFLLGPAFVSLTLLLSLHFERVHGFDPFGRGVVQFLFGLGIVVGLVVGARLASGAITSGREPRLAAISGLSGVVTAGGLALLAVSPWAWGGLVAVGLAASGAGSFQPAYYPLVGLVAPPRVRSQAYAWSILYVALGGLLGIGFFALGDRAGYRVALGVLAMLIGAGGLVARSAQAHVARDVRQAADTLAAAAARRRDLAEGEPTPLLACHGVEVVYGQVQVLFGVDLEVHDGEIVALLGTNGAGKSTLLKAISGLVDPVGGAVFFDGQDITHADVTRVVGLGITQVPGGRAVFPTLTVAEHLRLAGRRVQEGPAHVARATRAALDTFPVLADRRAQLAGNLSGGEQQMLGLAMALIARPRLLIIDELSLGLAPVIVGQLLDVVRRIRDQGTAVLVVEQSVNVALTLAGRAYFLEKGEVRFEGRAAELLGRDDLLRSVFLAGAVAGSRDVAPRGDGAGRPEDHRAGDVVLRVAEVSKRFGGIHAVDGASLELRDGEIVGIIGPNGAGKTTLFDLVSGFERPDQGRIELLDRDVTAWPAQRRSRLGLARSFQDARLVPSLTVAENLAIALDRHLDRHDHVAAALRLPEVVRLEEDVAWTVSDLIDLLGLGAYRNKLVRELSTGTRRVVDLGMVVAHDPGILLLDEPSSGIAQREAEALPPLLHRIQQETGCAVLVIEHDMPLITAVSDRLVAMELGRVIAEGPPDEVLHHPQVVAAYLGADAAAVARSGAAGAVHPGAHLHILEPT